MKVAKLIRELAKDAAVMVVEHDLATLDFLSDRIHVFYGVPSAFGIVSKPYGTRVGINVFLDGFVKEDNVSRHHVSYSQCWVRRPKRVKVGITQTTAIV